MAHHPAPFPFNEEERVLSLEHLDVLDSANEKAFDDIVLLATTLCDAPIALVSLVDRERQWFKACVGLGVQETHRDLAFCGHAILDPVQVLVVEDAALDPRFASSPLVLGPPYIRFYAGAPIVTDSGVALGTVCVIDTCARQLSEPQSLALQALARQAAALLEARLLSKHSSKPSRTRAKSPRCCKIPAASPRWACSPQALPMTSTTCCRASALRFS
jgi:GAF domain-containing protein